MAAVRKAEGQRSCGPCKGNFPVVQRRLGLTDEGEAPSEGAMRSPPFLRGADASLTSVSFPSMAFI